MKSIFRSRRHRNPLSQQESRQENHTPFFSKIGGAMSVQAKPEPFFQTKLTIGQPGDPYEREADAIADQVVNQQAHTSVNTTGESIQRQPISTIQRLATPEEDKMPATNDARMAEDKRIQEKPEIQKMDKPEEEEPVQAKAEEEEPIQAKAGEEEEPIQAKEEEEEPMQAKSDIQRMEAPEQKEEEKATPSVQTKSNNAGKASPALTYKIKDSRGKGKPMPAPVRNQMEQHFGRDFSQVNIHTDNQAGDMNKQLNAQAFTHGSDIYFNSGKFNPQSTEGVHLLAHELTHTVQQNGEKVPAKDVHSTGKNHKGHQQNNMSSSIQRQVADAGAPASGPTVTPIPTDTTTSPLPQFTVTQYSYGGSHFQADYTPIGPSPQTGQLEITHRVHFTWDRRVPQSEKNEYVANYKQGVEQAWSRRHNMRLNEPNFAEYQAAVVVTVQEVTDPASAHTRITVHKRNPRSRRFRSFVRGGDTAELDSRDPTERTTSHDTSAAYIKQVGPFDHDDSSINTEVQSDIQEVETFARPRVVATDRHNLMSEHFAIDYIGRATSQGSSTYNRRLAFQRAQTVEARVNNDLGKSGIPTRVIEEGMKGEEHASNDAKFRRVDVRIWDVDRAFDPSHSNTLEQNTAAHEAGHMFGLGDEYVEEAPPRDVADKFEGDLPSHYEDVRRLMGEDAANELLVQNSGSIMSHGMEVRRGHYVYFLQALNNMTGKSWQVV